jgi:Mg-chelatase subunit ChlD
MGNVCDTEEGQRVETVNYGEDEIINSRAVTKAQQASNTTDISDLTTKIQLSMKTLQNPIELSSTREQIIPVQLKIDVDEIITSEKAPIDIILVLDHSGSMNGERMELAKEACFDLLQYLGPQDRVGLIKFDDEATKVSNLRTMTEKNKTQMVREIRKIEADGGTDITAGIKLAVEMLHRRKYVNAVSSIFLLSDGEDERAEEGVRNLIARFAFNDIFTINTFGFSHHHDPELMSAIAHEKDGNFYFIEELETIDECFADCLGGLLSVVADNVTVDIQEVESDVLPGLRINKFYGFDGAWQRNGKTHTRIVPHLISDRETNSIFEIIIPRTSNLIPEGFCQVKIGSAQVTIQGINYNNLQRVSLVKTIDLMVTFTNPGVQVQTRIIDGDVMFNYYRVRGAELLNQVHLACGRGKFYEARSMLTNLIKEMRTSILSVQDVEGFDELILDFEAAIGHAHQHTYNRGGKHHLLQHHRNHYDERSNIHSNVRYGNAIQANMVLAARNKKNQYGY